MGRRKTNNSSLNLKKILSFLWLTSLLSVCLAREIPASKNLWRSESEKLREETEQIGYGYEVEWAEFDKNGKSITAMLKVVQSSSVYGPDIDSLCLTARYSFHFLF